MVTRLIADGVGWVAGQVVPMHADSHPAASAAAALWAAVHVERGWPNDDSSLERARDLEKTMTTMLDRLVGSNDLANNPDETYGIEVVPMPDAYAFLSCW